MVNEKAVDEKAVVAPTEGEVSTKSAKAKGAAKKAAVPADNEPKPFAIVRTGGKQYRVSPGSRISVELLDVEAGSTVTFSDILMVGKVGGSDVKVLDSQGPLGVTITGRVVAHKKDKKVIIFKKRLKGGYTKKQGHRQQKSEVVIESFAV